jgi:hypothetical protein
MVVIGMWKKTVGLGVKLHHIAFSTCSVNNWLLGERCGSVGKLWILKHGQKLFCILSADDEVLEKVLVAKLVYEWLVVEFRASGLFFVER